MAKRRIRSLLAATAVLVMVVSGLFSGGALAQRGGGGGGTSQAAALTSDYMCLSRYTGDLRLAFSPSCPPGSTLIQISQSLPFDYCYSLYTGLLMDDRANDTCPPASRYVEIDGLESFAACYSPYTRQLMHTTPAVGCSGTWLPVFFIDLRGDVTKYACAEENLNTAACDFFPAGPHNEIRQIGPMVNTSGGFSDIHWQWVFDGNNSPTQRCVTDNACDNAAIEAALEALPGINDVTVTGGPIAGTINAPIRIEFVGVDAQTDILPEISILPIQNTNPQSDVTIVDGALDGPEVSYVAPGGTVQIFQATGATDPDNPATYGPEVTAGPQAVNAAGSFTATNLLEGDYVVCADATDAVAPSCELVTVNDNSQTLVNNVDLPGTITAAITDTAGVNEVQSITQCSFGCQVTGGTFTITFDGQTTAALDADATMAEVEAALETLANIDAVAVTGADFALGFNPGNQMLIEFQGVNAGQDVPQVTLTLALTGSGLGLFYENATVTEGSGVVQTLSADNRVSGGTFTLTYDDGVTSSTTTPLDWDATVAEIEAALNALPSISNSGSVTVVSTDPNLIGPETTPITKAPVEVNFSGVDGAETNVLAVDNTNLE